MIGPFLFFCCVALICIGAARLLAALLEHREARTRAARRAAELVAWGQTEAAVITAESQREAAHG